MKRIALILLSAAVLSASALAHDATADFKKFLNAELPKLIKAFQTKDISYFENISTSDFSEVEMGRTYNRADSMKEMKTMFDQTESVKCSFKLLSAKVTGNTGVAMTYGHMTSVMKPAKKGDKPHTMVVDMWDKETWVKSGDGWKIQKLEQAKPMKMTMDGKPMDPSKMGG